MKLTAAFAAAALLGAGPSALAQDASGGLDHSGMDHSAMSAAAGTPSSKAYREAVKSMHDKMDMEPTGDADLDFLEGMIPHHQGAIDMARIELEYGRDPKVKDLARKIIAAQEAEIAAMKRWIAERK